MYHREIGGSWARQRVSFKWCHRQASDLTCYLHKIGGLDEVGTGDGSSRNQASAIAALVESETIGQPPEAEYRL